MHYICLAYRNLLHGGISEICFLSAYSDSKRYIYYLSVNRDHGMGTNPSTGEIICNPDRLSRLNRIATITGDISSECAYGQIFQPYDVVFVFDDVTESAVRTIPGLECTRIHIPDNYRITEEEWIRMAMLYGGVYPSSELTNDGLSIMDNDAIGVLYSIARRVYEQLGDMYHYKTYSLDKEK